MHSYKIVQCTEVGVAECARAIKAGAIVVFPTDTIYGVGCDPYNGAAVERLFKIKGREENKPLPVLAYSLEDAKKIIVLDQRGMLLARKYWPGPLTIVAPLADLTISSKVTAGKKNIAVRVPANECVVSLLKHCKYLVGTSANISGQEPMTSADAVLNSSLDGFDVLLDGGDIENGIASTIVDMIDRRVIREGAIKATEINRLLGELSP